MSKIANFYENLQKSFRPKNAKKAAKKATSVFLASLLTITYISSSRFNENAQIEAAAKWLTGIEAETAEKLTATFTGEYDPKNPTKCISINNEEYSVKFDSENPTKSLTDEDGNITLPSGSYKFIDFKIGTNAKFKVKTPKENGDENTNVHMWLEGSNVFQGKNGEKSITNDSNDLVTSGGGASGGCAAIYLPENTSLYLRGSGSITATGGNGAQGLNASNGCFIDLYKKCKDVSQSDYRSDDKYELTNISTLLYNDMNKPCTSLGTIGGLNTGAGTGAGGAGGGGGGSAIGTDGGNGGKGGKGFETYKDLNDAFKESNKNLDLEKWVTTENSSTVSKRVTITNTKGNGASSEQGSNPGTVYFLNTGTINLSEGKGGEGGRAGQGMPNRNITEKYRILGGGFGDYNSGRNNDDYDNHYIERLGGLRLLLGAGGGGGGKGSDGKKIGAGGSGGGGGGAGGLSAAQYHLGLAENVGSSEPNYNTTTKVKELCTNSSDYEPNKMHYPYCGYAYGNANREYGHQYGPLIYHFNVEGDDAKAYYPFACNGGGGGGGGGGEGVGGGGSGGYINYVSRRQNFGTIIPRSDYLNRTTHTNAYWTWRSDHYKDFAPNWGMGGDPYSSSPSYRTADSPYVTTTNISDYRVVRFRVRNSGDTTDPLKFLKSTDSNSSATTYDEGTQYSVTYPTKYYIRNEERTYYDGYYEPTAGKVCKITNDSGKDGGNAVLRYRTYVNGDDADKQCSCFCKKIGTDDIYPVYPTAWGGQAGTNGEKTKAGEGGSAKNVAAYNKYYYNQEWKQWNDGHGMHDKGPGSRHQDKNNSKDPIGIGCSAEGFNGNNGGTKMVENSNVYAYRSKDTNYEIENEVLDISKIVLEMYMSDGCFTLRTNQKLENIFWTVDEVENGKTVTKIIENSQGKSQIPFKEEYFDKKIGLCCAPISEITGEKYERANVYYGYGTDASEKEGMCSYTENETDRNKDILESIAVKYTFNFQFKECDWNQTNDLLVSKEDSAYSPGEGENKKLYPYYEAKYNSTKIIPQLEVLYSNTKLVEGKHYYLNYYLAKTSEDNKEWQKVDPQGQITDQNKIQPIASTSVKNEGKENEEITTAESKIEDMWQYCKTPTSLVETGDRIVVEFVPKKGFSSTEKDKSQTLLTYRIVETDLSEGAISISLSPDTIVYDGTDRSKEKDKFSIGVYVKDVLRKLNKDEFEITWPAGPYTNVGTYTLKISPTTSTGFKGEGESTFKIVPYDIGSENTNYKLELDKTEFDFVNSPYSKDWPKPTVKIVRKDGASEDPLGLKESDYTVEYYDVNEDGSYSDVLTKKAGKKVAIAKGKNPYSYNQESTENADCNFTGMLAATYTISGTDIDDSGISILLTPESFTYNGNEQKPKIIITKENNGVTSSLVEGTDYTISWPNEDYTNAGNKNVIIKGIGDNGFTGERELKYKIDPVKYDPESSNWEMIITPDNFYYNGSKLVPKITVTHKGKTLEQNKDYTLEYSDDSIDAGDKLVTVKLKGNYSGEKELKYKIYNVSYNTTYGDGLSLSLPEVLSKDYDLNSADLAVTSIASSEESTKDTDLTKSIYIDGKNLKISTSAPASNYVISIKDKNNTIFPFYINLSIAKATPELNIKDKTAVYTGSGISIDEINLKFKNNESFGTIKDIVSFDYYIDKECTSLVKDIPINAGTYYVKAYVKAPNANYNNVTSNVATLTIQKAKQNLSGSKSYSGYPGSSIQIDTKTDANTKLTYKSADESIVQIDSQGKMLLMKDGTTKITTTAEGTENYEAATFEATVVVDKTLNSITAGDKIIDNNIQNNNSGNNGGSSGGSNNNGSNSGNGSTGGSKNSSGSNSNGGNSSQDGSSSGNNSSSNSKQDEEEKKGLPLVADKFWSTILTTGDKSIYIISIALVSIAIAITILIVLKRKEKDE